MLPIDTALLISVSTTQWRERRHEREHAEVHQLERELDALRRALGELRGENFELEKELAAAQRVIASLRQECAAAAKLHAALDAAHRELEQARRPTSTPPPQPGIDAHTRKALLKLVHPDTARAPGLVERLTEATRLLLATTTA
jgi:septal ring factor EnvC (AmiA/AmiB activator)